MLYFFIFIVLLKDGAHIETYEGAGRIMMAEWNYSGDKVE